MATTTTNGTTKINTPLEFDGGNKLKITQPLQMVDSNGNEINSIKICNIGQINLNSGNLGYTWNPNQSTGTTSGLATIETLIKNINWLMKRVTDLESNSTWLNSKVIELESIVDELKENQQTPPTPTTKYYYYAGWTLPTPDNVDTIINEQYPAESGSSVMNAAGKKTTSKSSFSLASVNLYYSTAKTNYYVLVPTGHAIYDTVFGIEMGTDSFTSQGTITVGNQIHTIYKSIGTTRNITSIEIK